jgi:outer membrane biosynthesis protein TonB
MRNDNDTSLIFYIVVSIILHILIYFLFHISLPFFKKDPIEEVMTFEVVPVQEDSNIKTQKHQKQEEKKVEKAKKRSKAKKKDPNPVPNPKKSPEKPKEQVKPTSVPLQKKSEQKSKDQIKPKPKASPKANEMEQLLKNLEKESQGKEEKSRKQAIEQKNTAIDDAIGKYKETSPMSIAEENYIRQKVIQNWNIPIGVQSAGEIIVNLHINLNTDGTLKDVTLGGVSCPTGSDLACKAAVDSAIRAVMQASPFDGLKADRYATWAEFKFNFDPKDALM